MNEYYVYEWIRLDTNEPFYVGKGKGNRCYKTNRKHNPYFNNIVKSVPVAVNILHDNLTEDVACDLEVWYIREYRDIIGYESMCNICDGGEGIALAGKYTSSARAVICITTGKIFDTARNGANYYKCDESQLTKCCRNKQHSAGKLNGEKLVWMWLDDYEKSSKVRIQEKINEKDKIFFKNNIHPRSKEIICITTNKVFKTIKDASEFYNIGKTGISQNLSGKVNSSGEINGEPLVWIYLEDYKKFTEEEIRRRLNVKNIKDNRVICITTGMIFKSATEASIYYNINYSGIGKCCKGKSNYCGKLKDGTPLVWEYYKDIEK